MILFKWLLPTPYLSTTSHSINLFVTNTHKKRANALGIGSMDIFILNNFTVQAFAYSVLVPWAFLPLVPAL